MMDEKRKFTFGDMEYAMLSPQLKSLGLKPLVFELMVEIEKEYDVEYEEKVAKLSRCREVLANAEDYELKPMLVRLFRVLKDDEEDETLDYPKVQTKHDLELIEELREQKQFTKYDNILYDPFETLMKKLVFIWQQDSMHYRFFPESVKKVFNSDFKPPSGRIKYRVIVLQPGEELKPLDPAEPVATTTDYGYAMTLWEGERKPHRRVIYEIRDGDEFYLDEYRDIGESEIVVRNIKHYSIVYDSIEERTEHEKYLLMANYVYKELVPNSFKNKEEFKYKTHPEVADEFVREVTGK